MSRLLNPSEFGLFGMLNVLSSLASVVVGMGFAQAIVQNQFLREEDLSSIFWASFFLGLAISLLFFFSATAIADFYGQPQLFEISRIFSLIFLIYGCSSVPLGILSKRIEFKELVISQLCGAFISYSIGIAAAYKGWGVWSLVIQAMTNHFIYVSLNVYFSRWRPSFHFKMASIAKIGKFSRNFLPIQLLDFFALNLDILLVGKNLGKSELGLYGRSIALVQLPVNSIGLIFNKTFFSVFASLQDQPHSLATNYIRAIKFFSFSLMPVLILTAVASEQIVLFLFGEQWVEMGPLVAWLAISSAIGSYNSFNDTVITSQGRTDLLLRINAAEKAILILSVLIGLEYGIMGIVSAKIISSVITFIPKLLVLSKVTKVSAWDWFKHQKYLFVAFALCGVGAFMVRGFCSVLIFDISIMCIVGVITGITFLMLVKDEILTDFLIMVKRILKTK